MSQLGILFAIGLASLMSVAADCPRNKIHRSSLDTCSYYIQCFGTISDVVLAEECEGSSNVPVAFDVTLNNPIEPVKKSIGDDDIFFLGSITTLRVLGTWPSNDFSILEYMSRLKHLYLSDIKLKNIEGLPFSKLYSLESIDLSKNNIEDVEDLFDIELYPNKLKKLSLAHNAIEELPGYAFQELTSLVELDLSYNNITDLNEEPFLNLTNLQKLNLNNNNIKDINGALNSLPNLRHLYLRENKIENIEPLKTIFHLETFDLSGNNLRKIKPKMFIRHWQHVGSDCKIMLANNEITHLPDVPADLSNRFSSSIRHHFVEVSTELDLSSNIITDVGYNAFQSIARLSKLDLSWNKIIAFDVNTTHLAYLKYLNLSCNYISSIQFKTFYSMNLLQNLDLSHNIIDHIPEHTFEDNFVLKYVNMSHNELTDILHLHIKMFHPDGGVLDLSKNNLARLNIPASEGLRLTNLILHTNNISDPSLINLSSRKELTHLDMSHNSIEFLNETSLSLPSSMIWLDLNFNKIRKIGPSTFKMLSNLKTLRLAHNNIAGIDYGTFSGLTTLLNLDLSYNSIAKLDSILFMDLKYLAVLSIRYNYMDYLEYSGWFGHKIDLKVYIDGNNFPCKWLSTALTDYNNGYSKMKPTILMETVSKYSLEGIPCIEGETEYLIGHKSDSELSQERLLVVAKKILAAVLQQNYYLKSLTTPNIFNGNLHIRNYTKDIVI